MHSLSTIELAAIRRTECLEYAERYRLAQQAANPAHGRRPWGRAVRDELTALRARMSATRRPDLTPSTDLATAAAETA
jgi:hypothetical protein